MSINYAEIRRLRPPRGSWGLSLSTKGYARYLLAIMICSTALLLRLSVLPVESGLAFLTFFPSVMIVALLLGTGPAILTIAVCSIIGHYIFIPPYWAFKSSPDQLVAVSIFSLSGLLFTWLAHQMREVSKGQALLAAIVETSDDAIASKTLDGIITSWNPAAERLFGYTAAEAIGQPMTIIFPQDRLDEEQQLLDRVKRGETVYRYETKRKNNNGSEFDVSVNLSPIFDMKGRVIGVSKIAFDITERKALEDRLKEAGQQAVQSRDFMTSILNSVSSHIAIIDSTGEIINVNEPWSQFAKENSIHDDQLGVGENYLAVCRRASENDPMALEASNGIAAVLDGRAPEFIMEYPCHSPDIQRWFLMRVRPLIGGKGAVVSHDDISILKAVESELRIAREFAEHANLAKSRFLATMSHELRTPLNSIIGFAELLQNTQYRNENEGRCDEYLGDIRSGATHLLDIINDVLDISKIEVGRVSIDRANIEAEGIINSIVRIVSEQAHKRRITISIDVEQGSGAIWADERAIKQILFNLLSNAIKFSSEGGKITVKANSSNGGIDIAVSDTGAGIPTDQLDRILWPFEQLDNRYSRSEGGTGLGLSLVQGLIKLHGGQLTVESTLGVGSKFLVHFPGRESCPAV